MLYKNEVYQVFYTFVKDALDLGQIYFDYSDMSETLFDKMGRKLHCFYFVDESIGHFIKSSTAKSFGFI